MNLEGGEDHDNVEEENDDQEIYRPILHNTENCIPTKKEIEASMCNALPKELFQSTCDFD